MLWRLLHQYHLVMSLRGLFDQIWLNPGLIIQVLLQISRFCWIFLFVLLRLLVLNVLLFFLSLFGNFSAWRGSISRKFSYRALFRILQFSSKMVFFLGGGGGIPQDIFGETSRNSRGWPRFVQDSLDSFWILLEFF